MGDFITRIVLVVVPQWMTAGTVLLILDGPHVAAGFVRHVTRLAILSQMDNLARLVPHSLRSQVSRVVELNVAAVAPFGGCCPICLRCSGGAFGEDI